MVHFWLAECIEKKSLRAKNMPNLYNCKEYNEYKTVNNIKE